MNRLAAITRRQAEQRHPSELSRIAATEQRHDRAAAPLGFGNAQPFRAAPLSAPTTVPHSYGATAEPQFAQPCGYPPSALPAQSAPRVMASPSTRAARRVPGSVEASAGAPPSAQPVRPQFASLPVQSMAMRCMASPSPHSARGVSGSVRRPGGSGSCENRPPNRSPNSAGPDDCAICCDAMERETFAQLDSCVHRFHFDCIVKWVDRANCCPLCKATVHEIESVCNGKRKTVHACKDQTLAEANAATQEENEEDELAAYMLEEEEEVRCEVCDSSANEVRII
ncbi:hypothetical protein T492DRAFT_473246 [Pavlovales sp. CCMP2436]|nr:hypothetical protein T492DRAFT_473246 [Pavlovales sp. CCMP2436]